jgi:hypothetical protein
MDKSKRRERFQQKKRNHDKWEHRVKERKVQERRSTVLYDDDIKEIGMLAGHGKLCSCDLCCNPRRSEWVPKKERLTMQERRSVEL